MALRRRIGPVRRGEFFPFVPTAAAVITPARPPDWIQHRRPATRRAAHGEFLPVALPTGAPVPFVSRRRPTRPPGRRGELWPMPLAGAVAGIGPWLPRPLSRRRISAQVRRGEFLVVPLAGLAPVAPPPVPSLLTHRTTRVLPRRGEFLPVVAAPAYCAAPVPRRRRPAAAVRRGRGWTAPPIVVVPAGPGPWLPRTLRAPVRLSPRRAARGHYWPISIESVCDPITHRPNTGTTTRPNAGVTTRPHAC
jgi:hypothetical protein